MLLALAWQDHLVVATYLLLVIGIGWYSSRRTRSDDEYFLAGRSVPWGAVGLSIIATLLSSLTYISEPGEVWQSGVTNLGGKTFAVILEAIVVWVVLIPFLMRFRFTSAYEYLGYRFGSTARWLGVGLFSCLTISWMGFVVLAMAKSLTTATGMPLPVVIATVGLVATLYTVLGGMRAVIWTDVMQILLMLGGCFLCIGFVIAVTGMGPWDWLRETNASLAERKPGAVGIQWFSLDPFERTTVLTFGLSMFVWHLCTHAGNQMTVQRYFSCADLRQARLSFATAALFSIIINGLLAVVGLAVVAYYHSGHGTLTLDPNKRSEADQIFPLFMVRELPPGLSGAVLAAVLAAAMSTIDSGVNALATVLAVERRREEKMHTGSAGMQVGFARWVTLFVGLFVTLSAYGLDQLTAGRNIVEMMPRTFNCFVVPMGGMFLLGIFLPFCGGRGAVFAAVVGFITAVNLGYAKEIYGLERDISFTLVLPVALLAMVVTALLMRLAEKPSPEQVRGLTWSTIHERPAIDSALLAPRAAKE